MRSGTLVYTTAVFEPAKHRCCLHRRLVPRERAGAQTARYARFARFYISLPYAVLARCGPRFASDHPVARLTPIYAPCAARSSPSGRPELSIKNISYRAMPRI